MSTVKEIRVNAWVWPEHDSSGRWPGRLRCTISRKAVFKSEDEVATFVQTLARSGQLECMRGLYIGRREPNIHTDPNEPFNNVGLNVGEPRRNRFY
jgi:hypothetical protein